MTRLKTTPRHFAIFKEEAEECAKLWGLNDLSIYYHHGKREARASFIGRHCKRVATVVLSTEWEEINAENRAAISDDDVRKCARHEMVHALLLPMAAMIATHCTQDEAEEAEERIVQRLLRILPEPSRRSSK